MKHQADTQANILTQRLKPGAYLAPGCPSLYLLVRHEPSASITGADVKFSLAISSMPFLRQQHKQGMWLRRSSNDLNETLTSGSSRSVGVRATRRSSLSGKLKTWSMVTAAKG